MATTRHDNRGAYYVSGISLDAIADMDLFVSEDGKTWLPSDMILHTTAKSGTIVTPPTVSIGTNSPNFDNIVPATLLTGASAISQTFHLLGRLLSTPPAIVAGGSTVKLRVSIAVAGVGPSMTVGALVKGEYIP